jgi:hypothetical protein
MIGLVAGEVMFSVGKFHMSLNLYYTKNMYVSMWPSFSAAWLMLFIIWALGLQKYAENANPLNKFIRTSCFVEPTQFCYYSS